MSFDEDVDVPLGGLLDLAVVAEFGGVDIQRLVELDQFDAGQLVFVLGAAMTDECLGGRTPQAPRE